MSDPLPALLHSLAGQRAAAAPTLKEINQQQLHYDALRKPSTDPNAASHSWSAQEKLRILYEKAHAQASDEWRLAQEILANVRANLRQRREVQRKAIAGGGDDMSDDEEDDDDEPLAPAARSHASMAAAAAPPPAPSGGGRVPVLSKTDRLNIWHHDVHSVLPNGSAIAALVDEHSIPPLWIQSSVKSYRGGARPKYEVVDEDPGDGGEDESGGGATGGVAAAAAAPPRQKRYLLDPRKVLPLPSLEQVPLSARREFPKGTRVLAVFPVGGITVLYPAEVVQAPKRRKNNEYLLMFDDDEEVHRAVNAQFVAPMVEFKEDNA